MTGGNLEITDPQNRNDLAVTSTDTVLGAAVAGAPTTFTTPTTTGISTTNLNQLVGSTAGLTDATAIANGESPPSPPAARRFTYTAAGGTGTVGDLLNAITNPSTDPAGLNAFLDATGHLVVTDPNNNGEP